MPPMIMKQEAPYPEELVKLLTDLNYMPGWTFHLYDTDRGQGSSGLTLIITVDVPDSYHPEQKIRVAHYMLVPPASFNRRSWQKWLFDQIMLVHQHEAMEFFQIDGNRPYAPNHGPGWCPYLITEVSTTEDRRTNFKGEVNDH